MTRKIFIMFFAAATSYCAIPSGLYAEAASPISRIGILIPESAPGESQTIKGLKDGLSLYLKRQTGLALLECVHASD